MEVTLVYEIGSSDDPAVLPAIGSVEDPAILAALEHTNTKVSAEGGGFIMEPGEGN